MPALPPWLLIFPILGALVLFHELGHFATAKLFGIKVLEFGFGFPPKLLGIPFRGTIYSVNLIPLGGFVRMLGEEDPTDPESFARQSVGKRMIVLAAGSSMNMLLPVIIFTILFALPHETMLGGSVIVTSVAPSSPAQEAGLRAGDVILAVDGEAVTSPSELIALAKDRGGDPIELSLRKASGVTGLASSPEFMTSQTVSVVPRTDPPRLKVVEQVTNTQTQVSVADASRYDSTLEVGDTMTQGAIGVMIGLTNAKFGMTTEPVWTAVGSAVKTIWSVLSFTWSGIADGISTGTNPGIAGPVGIAQATGEIVEERGFSQVYQMAAILSISLGVLNMLPIPALDGGRFMFVVIEWVRRGKRVSPKKEGLVHLVGFAVLIGLILVITFFDIIKVASGESFLR
ncbi:MAG: M50 family metallopeptidase [SAR202 cluster bacterium]|nr:M50 family metallopeptidase [SAR202 cluster bacterium]